MPGFSSYSQIVKPAEFVEPVSLDLLAKGTVYKEQMLEKNLEDVNNLISYMDNIPSLQGIDTEKKNEILNNVKQQASQLSYSDLGNPAVANQLKSYITSVTKDPDMQGIIERGYAVQEESKKQADAMAKGKKYYSPILDQAENYMNKGLYIRNTKFNGRGFLDPELNKLTTEALKNVVTEKTIDKNGKVTLSPRKESLDFEMSKLYNDPSVQQYLDYTFEAKYKDRDWASEGLQEAQQNLIQLSQAKNFYTQALQKDPNNYEYRFGLAQAEEGMDMLKAVMNNPGLNGENLKTFQKQQERQEMIEEAKKVYDYNSFEKWDVSPIVQQAQKHANQLSEITAQGDKEINVHNKNNESDYIYNKKAIDEGYQIVKGTDGSTTMTKPVVLQPVETAITNILTGASLSENQENVVKTLLQDNMEKLFGKELADKDIVNMSIEKEPKTNLRYAKIEADETFNNADRKVYFINSEEEWDKIETGGYYVADGDGKVHKKGDVDPDGTRY